MAVEKKVAVEKHAAMLHVTDDFDLYQNKAVYTVLATYVLLSQLVKYKT